jgi:hypothetical protein
LLRKFIQKNYEQYSGLVLENYLHEKIAEEGAAACMGNYRDSRGENEIDLIALNDMASAAVGRGPPPDKTALVAEIKRNPKKINLAVLELKTEKIRQELADYAVEYRGLSMEDM